MNQQIDDPADDAPDPDSIVKHRKQLLGAVDFSSWSSRLARFMASQSGFSGDVEISDIRLPSAGGSSGTLIYTARLNQDKKRVQRDFVLRYATEGGLFHSYNLPGQYSILEALQGTGVPVRRVNGDTAPSSYHKLAFLGNPAADLAHQVQTHAFLGLGGELLAGFPSEQEWYEQYETASGRKLLDREYLGAVAAFKLHIDLLLVYREVTPDMEAARNAVRAYTWQNLTDRLAAAKNGRR